MELDQRVQYWPGIPEESLLYIFTYNEVTLVDSVDLNEHSVRLYSSADETRPQPNIGETKDVHSTRAHDQ